MKELQRKLVNHPKCALQKKWKYCFVCLRLRLAMVKLLMSLLAMLAEDAS
jgi:hypothetical protein